jgi:hypothetical protein
MNELSIIAFRASMLVFCFMIGSAPALEPKAMQSMVIVEGDKGRGSAFVVAMNGKVYLVTNSHVIRGNQNVKFKNLRNDEILTRPLEIADKVDAVRAEIVIPSPALELVPTVEQILKIGDEILVAGNSEGEGVVREIPGKVVGIGPDRVEVDAPFVPGNSGSPILLKSTGQVIGVATYINIPPSFRGAPVSSTRLNEVRRFGYRLDTVTKWISPANPDRLSKEGLKLAENDEFFLVIMQLLNCGADTVANLGASAFIPHEQAAANANFAGLSATIEEFAKTHKATTDRTTRMQNATRFFQQLKDASLKNIEGYSEVHFSGYFSIQFKDQLNRLKQFHDWFNGTTMAPYRDLWLAAVPMPSGNPNQSDLIRGMVALWQANGNALDTIGGANGSLSKTTFVPGVRGGAFDFASSDAAVVMDPSALNHNYSAITIFAWAKARSHGQADYDGFGRTIISCTEGGGFALRVLNGKIQLDLRGEDGKTHQLNFDHPTLPLNTWIQVGATYDGRVAKAYLNGLPAGNVIPITGRIKKTTIPTARLIIGNEPGKAPEDPAGVIQPGRFGWDGQLDELAIYDRAIDEREISQLFTLTRPMENPLTPELLSGKKWIGGEGFWIEFLANGNYREFWQGGEYPGIWKLVGGKEVHVSRQDGWNYVFTPSGTRNLLRVWQAKPGQEPQRDEIFQPVEGTPTSERLAIAETRAKTETILNPNSRTFEFRVLNCTGGQLQIQKMAQFGMGKWNDDDHLFWSGASPSAKLNLSLLIANAGTYDVIVFLTKANDYGVVQFELNGPKIGGPVDLYNPSVIPSGAISLGTHDLSAGAHRLSVEIVGSNEQALKSYMFGLDHFILKMK